EARWTGAGPGDRRLCQSISFAVKKTTAGASCARRRAVEVGIAPRRAELREPRFGALGGAPQPHRLGGPWRVGLARAPLRDDHVVCLAFDKVLTGPSDCSELSHRRYHALAVGLERLGGL